MRHQVKRHRLGRGHAHRKATLAALSTALIAHKRITTTVTRAKALRVYVEPLLNRAKEDTTHNRREVFRHLQNKEAVTTLFSDVASKIGDRPGGYTRVVKLGRRAGDAAEMAIIELVDYNDVRPGGAAGGGRKRRTRRGTSGSGCRRGAGAKATATQASAAAPVASPEAAPEPEVDETVDQAADVAEVEAEDTAEVEALAPEADVVEEPAAEEPAADATSDEAAPEEATDDEEKKEEE